MTVRVLALSSGTTGLEDHRHAIASLITPAGPLQTRGGVFAAVGGAADLVSVSAMQAKITPHYAWIDGGAALEAGYDFASDADVTLTFDPGEPGVTRVDRVIDRVRNNPYDGSGSLGGSVEILKGQQSGAATALPPNSELLWEVPVPAGASAGSGGLNFNAIKVDKRRYTVAIGGMLPVKDAAERDAIVNPYNGLPIWRRDRAWREVYDGAAWRVQGTATIASAADRAAITNPYNGQVIARTDRGWLERYDGAKWRVVGVATVAAFADLATYITDPYAGQLAVAGGEGREYRYNATVSAWRVHGQYRDQQTLAATAGSITFSNIPSYLRTLTVAVTARGDAAGKGSDVQFRVNGDGGNNYLTTRQYVVDNGPGVFTTGLTAFGQIGSMPAAGSPANRWGSMVGTFNGWDSPHAGALSCNAQGGYTDTAANNILVHNTNVYIGNGPYTSLTLIPISGNFLAGTQATITGAE